MLHTPDGPLTWIADGKRALLMWLLAPLVALGEDNPEHMIWLRLQLASMWLLTLTALAAIAARLTPAAPRLAAAATASLATLLHPLLWSALELRPDSAAICMMASSLALLAWAPTRPNPRAWSAAAGLLAALACSASVKALVYGAPLAPLALLSLLPRLRALFPHPIHFSLGFASIAALTLIITLATGSLNAYWHGLYGMVQTHETLYPKLDPWRLIRPVLRQHSLHAALTLLGATSLAGHLATQRPLQDHRLAPLAALSLVWCGGWASYLMQRGAYDYSLIPGLALSCVFAGVATASLYNALHKHIPTTALAASAALVSALFTWQSWTLAQRSPDNSAQREVHAQLHNLTAATDVAYDMSASFVYRKRAHHFEFLDQLRKQKYQKELQTSIPESILQNQAVLFIMDSRFYDLKNTKAGKFLLENYQPYNNDLRLWGRSWNMLALHHVQDFTAIRDDEYFFYPYDILKHADIFIDNKPVTTPIISLKRGPHKIHATRRAGAPQQLSLIWLPNNGERFNPDRPSGPLVLGKHILPGGIQPEL